MELACVIGSFVLLIKLHGLAQHEIGDGVAGEISVEAERAVGAGKVVVFLKRNDSVVTKLEVMASALPGEIVAPA
jgi:hypothetical protein